MSCVEHLQASRLSLTARPDCPTVDISQMSEELVQVLVHASFDGYQGLVAGNWVHGHVVADCLGFWFRHG